MTDQDDLPATSAAHLAAIDQAMSDETIAGPGREGVVVRNFTYSADMLPGWTLARARQIDTGRGMRLVQVNAQSEGADAAARIETLESADADAGIALFRETLTRFQHDPASILRTPPEIGQAEAVIGDGTVVFLRGNLVVTVSSIVAGGLPVEDLARAIDAWITSKPAEAPGDSGPVTGKPMIKSFDGGDSYVIGSDGAARRLASQGGSD